MNKEPDMKGQPEQTGDTEIPETEIPEFESNRDLLIYFYLQIKQNRKWFLIPLWLVLAFLALFASLTGNTTILPAIYALF